MRAFSFSSIVVLASLAACGPHLAEAPVDAPETTAPRPEAEPEPEAEAEAEAGGEPGVDPQAPPSVPPLDFGAPPPWAAIAEGSEGGALERFGGAWDTRHAVLEIVADTPDGEAVWGEVETSSCISVLPDGDRAEVEINTASINMHACLLEGRGGLNGAGELVVETDTPFVSYDTGEMQTGPRCWIRFSFEGRVLRLAEVWPRECARNIDWCGARGEMVGHEFPLSDRRRGRRCASYDEVRNRTSP